MVRQSHPLPLQETPPSLAGRSGSVSMGSLLLPLGPNVHTTLCVPFKRGVSVPLVLSKSCTQIPLAFKVWFSRNSSSRCLTPRFGSLTWGSEPSLQWVDFCGISILLFVGHPPSSYGIWCYCDCTPPTISLWLFLCLWMWGIFFGEFQCLTVDDFSVVNCDSSVFARGSESTSFCSAILNQSRLCHCVFIVICFRYFLISCLISSVISWLLSSVLFSLHVFVCFTDFFL